MVYSRPDYCGVLFGYMGSRYNCSGQYTSVARAGVKEAVF